MIAARIGHDHFLVWRMEERRAAALVPGLRPVVGEGTAWLLCAAAEFAPWRLFGLPGCGRLRTAAWLVPCALPDGRIGNAFVRRFVDHPLVPRGWSFAGWSHAGIRISDDSVAIANQATASAGEPSSAVGLKWFDADRCGLLPGRNGWSHWPIAKRDWRWSFRSAAMRSPVANAWGAQACGIITVHRTLAVWGAPAPAVTLASRTG